MRAGKPIFQQYVSSVDLFRANLMRMALHLHTESHQRKSLLMKECQEQERVEFRQAFFSICFKRAWLLTPQCKSVHVQRKKHQERVFNLTLHVLKYLKAFALIFSEHLLNTNTHIRTHPLFRALQTAKGCYENNGVCLKKRTIGLSLHMETTAISKARRLSPFISRIWKCFSIHFFFRQLKKALILWTEPALRWITLHLILNIWIWNGSETTLQYKTFYWKLIVRQNG